MKMRPAVFTWSGTAMVPQPRFMPLCAKQYAVGETYPLMPVEDRSMASHNQYFAAISDGWHSIPETLAPRWPSEEHLRKWCLVECGFFEEKEFESEFQWDDSDLFFDYLGLYMEEGDGERCHPRWVSY